MAIRILTDSTADFTSEEAKKLNITVVPLKVMFNETQYRDGIDLSNEEFYKRLIESDVLPTTSQPAPNDFLIHFEEAQEANDEIIAILVSGGLSGTFQSANLAKNICGYEGIHLIDSQQVAISLKLLVEVAAQRVKEGKTAQEIVTEVETLKSKVKLLAIIPVLDYLVKGGRLSKGAAVAGTLLSIKPIITIDEGKVAVVTKARGIKGAFEAMNKEIDKFGEVDSALPLTLAYTHTNELAIKYKEYIAEKGILADNMTSIGAAIGTHAGPGACAIAYFRK